jgi:hypothetical protein
VTAPTAAAAASAKIVDFNVHDLVGIRLVGPSPTDVQAVERHLGLRPAGFSGEPALTIRFVESLPINQPLRFLGREDVGFTSDQFIVLRSHNLARARTRLAMEQIGQSCELTCETGLSAIPLLRQLLNVVMLARGIVPVHAAAFRHQGHGVMVTGWSHGSKTGTMLAFMAEGADFIGDEWIYLSASGDRMFGLPDHLEARPWYLRELPEYRRQVGTGDRIRTGLASGIASLLGPFVPRSERSSSLRSKIVRRAHQALLDQQSITLRPERLFGAEKSILEGRLDVVIVAVSHGAPEFEVTVAPVEQVASRMAASFLHEQAGLLSCYRKHLFAFPGRRSELLDQLELVYRRQALQALAGKPAYTMLHPYPVSVEALRTAVQPLLGAEVKH